MGILDDRTVRNLRRNQDDISVLEQIGTLSDLHTDVPFQEKIKLIIIVGMRPHLCHPAIAVIIKVNYPLSKANGLPASIDLVTYYLHRR